MSVSTMNLEANNQIINHKPSTSLSWFQKQKLLVELVRILQVSTLYSTLLQLKSTDTWVLSKTNISKGCYSLVSSVTTLLSWITTDITSSPHPLNWIFEGCSRTSLTFNSLLCSAALNITIPQSEKTSQLRAFMKSHSRHDCCQLVL